MLSTTPLDKEQPILMYDNNIKLRSYVSIIRCNKDNKKLCCIKKLKENTHDEVHRVKIDRGGQLTLIQEGKRNFAAWRHINEIILHNLLSETRKCEERFESNIRVKKYVRNKIHKAHHTGPPFNRHSGPGAKSKVHSTLQATSTQSKARDLKQAHLGGNLMLSITPSFTSPLQPMSTREINLRPRVLYHPIQPITPSKCHPNLVHI
ncbi:hypothetical protein YC2023_038706 [Brassica napus]